MDIILNLKQTQKDYLAKCGLTSEKEYTVDNIIDTIRNQPGVMLCQIDDISTVSRNRFCVCFVRRNPLESISYCGTSKKHAIYRLIESLSGFSI